MEVKMRRYVYLAVIYILVFNSDLFSQNLSVGFYGGMNFNMNKFKYEMKNIDRTEVFTAPNFGLIGSYCLSDYFTFSLRVGYNSMREKVFIKNMSLYDFQGNRINAKEYSDYHLSFLEITPIVEINNILPLKNLYFSAGIEFGIPLEKNYDMIYSYDVADISQKNMNFEIDKVNMRFAAVLGLGYHWEISNKITISPEISYRYAFTDISNEFFNDVWRLNQFRISINITYKL